MALLVDAIIPHIYIRKTYIYIGVYISKCISTPVMAVAVIVDGIVLRIYGAVCI